MTWDEMSRDLDLLSITAVGGTVLGVEPGAQLEVQIGQLCQVVEVSV